MSFPPALPLQLVIFDCDGVLVDSEGPSNRTVAAEVTALGWPMDEAESMRHFVGFTLEQIAPMVTARTGRLVPPGWVDQLRARIIAAMEAEVELIPGIPEVLCACQAMGVPFRVASNSSQGEMAAKFRRTGLEWLLPRAHSAYEVAAGKPAPDVFLLAASTEGVPPGACLVIEDSVPGATGALAAGMACLGFAPHGDGAALQAVGATPFASMADLPALIRTGLRQAA